MNVFNFFSRKITLIDDLKRAEKILSQYSGGYSGEHDSAEHFHQDLKDRIQKLENGDESVLDDLWVWFAPTCQWDDFVGDAELGERIYGKVCRLRKPKNIT